MSRRCLNLLLATSFLQRNFSTAPVRCRAKVIDGKAIAKSIRKELRIEVEKWVEMGNRRPHLTAVVVGDDPASKVYVKNKMKAAKHTGITSRVVLLPQSITEAELVHFVHSLNYDDTVDGLLVQLPLPSHLNERKICDSVAPWKDVDGFSVINIGRVCSNVKAMVPATPAGVVELIKRTGIQTMGKNAVVCGRSKNVGMPIAMLLHSDAKNGEHFCDATTTICHRYTPDEELKLVTRSADILVVATGVPGLIKADMVKEGAVVIDVGINQLVDRSSGITKLVGDVDFEGVSERASYITPVPGGVGPMTVAMLMKNTLIAARHEIDFDDLPSRYSISQSTPAHPLYGTSMDIEPALPWPPPSV